MFLRVIMAVLVLVVLGGSILASQSDQARYQYYDRWYPPTFQTEGIVDAVIIGRSGLQTAMNADQFSEEMTELSGEDFVAIDLSKSWSGVDTHYVQARDALNNLTVDTLIVQIYPDASREHEMFYQLATYEDIWTGTFAYADRTTIEKMQQALNLSLRKWSEFLASALTGDLSAVQFDGVVSGPSDPTPGGDAYNAEAREAWVQAVGADWRNKPWMLWSLDAEFDARNRFFYDQIVELAEERDVRLVFLYLPQLYDAPVTQNFVEALQARFGEEIEVIAPGLDDLEWIYEHGFADHGHATANGQQYLTAMYARLLHTVLREGGGDYPVVTSRNTEAPAAPLQADLSAVADLSFAPAQDNLFTLANGITYIVPAGVNVAMRDSSSFPVFMTENMQMITRVFPEMAVGAGETLVVSGEIANLAGVDPLQLRLIYSRDCSLLPEDYSETILSIEGNASVRFSLPHTFRDSHDCSKILVQTLNATQSSPAIFQLGELQLSGPQQ